MLPTAAIDTDSADIWGTCEHYVTSRDDQPPESTTDPCDLCREKLDIEYVPDHSILGLFNNVAGHNDLKTFGKEKYRIRPDGQAVSWGPHTSTEQNNLQFSKPGIVVPQFNAILWHDRPITAELYEMIPEDYSSYIEFGRHLKNPPSDKFRNWLKSFTAATTFWPIHKVYQTKKVNGKMYRRLLATLDWTWDEITTLFNTAEDIEWIDNVNIKALLFPYIGNYNQLKNLYGSPQAINYKNIK